MKSLVVSLPEVSYFTVRFKSPCGPELASSTVIAGSACVILRVSAEGGGMGPKLLLSLSTFQLPAKLGLSAAAANEASAAISNMRIVIFFIARDSPLKFLLFVEHEHDVEFLALHRDVVVDGHHFAAVGKRHRLFELQLHTLIVARAFDDQLVAGHLGVALGRRAIDGVGAFLTVQRVLQLGPAFTLRALRMGLGDDLGRSLLAGAFHHLRCGSGAKLALGHVQLPLAAEISCRERLGGKRDYRKERYS